MKTAFLASVFILAQAGYLVATDESCDGDDVDAMAMLGMSLYQSESVLASMNETSTVSFKAKLDYAIMDQQFDAIKVADSDDDNPGVASRASSGANAKFAQALYTYYYDVCPAIWYRAYYWKWFFVTGDLYCWPVNSLWLPKCVCNYCKLRPYYYDTWYSHLQCVLEYSWTYIPSVCYNTKTGYFGKAYLRRYLPRGCCCKSYWRYGLVQQKQCVVAAKVAEQVADEMTDDLFNGVADDDNSGSTSGGS